MGVLLGDGGFGNSHTPVISNSENDILTRLNVEFNKIGMNIIHSKNDDYRIINSNITPNTKGEKGVYKNILKIKLDELNLLNRRSYDKFIPDIYKFNSPEIRLKILQGLIDTDGFIDNTSSKQLAKDVQFIVQSLGGTAKIIERMPKYIYNGVKKEGRVNYRVYISEPSNIKFYTSEKHLNKIPKTKQCKNPYRIIKSINYIGKEECQCIKVDNPTELYLTDEFIVTHNTTFAIQEMNSNINKKYIYITPFLSEIDRVIANTNINMKAPEHKGKGKLESFEYLISTQQNIASTHVLFQRFYLNKKEKLKNGHYTLFLDEVMNVIQEIDDITEGDINLLIGEKIIRVDSQNYVHWIKDYTDTKYDAIKQMAENNSLILVNKKLMVWNFPVDIFDCFEEVYILTYKFDGQIMKHYYDYHNVKYKKYSVKKINITDDYIKYKLIDYSPENEFEYIDRYRKLINVYTNPDLNAIGDKKSALSVSWFKRSSKELKIVLKNNIYNYFRNKVKGKAYDNMWTTFKDYKKTLRGDGYRQCVLIDEFNKPLKDENDKEIVQDCFVSFNARATNDYKFKRNLAYMCNVYIHPNIKQFFNLKGIEFNEDEYALSELIQWVFRSAIREGKIINIYIPSKRMRTFLINWLNNI